MASAREAAERRVAAVMAVSVEAVQAAERREAGQHRRPEMVAGSVSHAVSQEMFAAIRGERSAAVVNSN